MKSFSNLSLLGSVAAVVAFAAGCSGSTVDVGGYSADAGGAAPTTDGGGTTITGAKVEIHVRASTAAVPHNDGLSGQTPSDQQIGIRSLRLLKDAADKSPLLVFDHGGDAVLAGLNDKDDTVVATVAAKSLAAGRYTVARVGIGYVKYRVNATMHAMSQTVAGTFDNVQVLSNGTVVDGKTFDKGHYSFTFSVGGSPLATQPGEGGPVPQIPAGGGISLDVSGDESAYVFPVDVPVDPNVANDVKMIFELNTHENFRWEDQKIAGYAAGVFDVTPTTYEPVMRFGANSFRLVADLSSL